MDHAGTSSERYQLLELVGEGVSARVHRARDAATGGIVAVKVLNPHLATDAVSLERFRREIEITRVVGHPHVVSIHDLVVEPGRTFLVMEYIDGLDLRAQVRRDGPLPVEVVLDVARQVLDVLAACHAKGVIHRDLKPQNLLRTADGIVKVVDFGVSRMTALTDLTQTGTTLGSPEYMAPELFVTNTYDPRTDLYALGVILFELLTGELPFRGDSMAALYHQHRTAEPPWLAERRPDAPEWLRHVVERLLAKSPHERYQSAEEVAADLVRERVLARGLPALPKRECAACRRQTLADLPWCTACGFELGTQLGGGRFDLATTETTDGDALGAWVGGVLGGRLPATVVHPAVLVAGVDHGTAELLRQGALPHGVVLAVRRHAALAGLKQAAALVGLAFCALVALANLRAAGTSSEITIFRATYVRPPMERMMAGARAVAFGLFGWLLLGVAQRNGRRPLVDARLVQAGEATGETAWLRDLVPAERKASGGALEGLVPRLVEKFLLVTREPGCDPALRVALQRTLRTAAEVVIAASELDAALDPTVLARHAARYAALEDEIATEDDPGKRARLEQRRRMLVGVLERTWALQDAQATLLGRLVQIHARVGTLLGKLLVLRVPLDAADGGALEESVQALRRDVGVAREVQADLRRAA